MSFQFVSVNISNTKYLSRPSTTIQTLFPISSQNDFRSNLYTTEHVIFNLTAAATRENDYVMYYRFLPKILFFKLASEEPVVGQSLVLETFELLARIV